MPSVQVLEAAALEAEAAAKWYEDQRTGLGVEFREALKAALDKLRDGLLTGSPWPGRLGERGVKRIRMKRFPYHVVFVSPETTLVVLAVAHHRRRPGYWSNRLGDAR